MTQLDLLTVSQPQFNGSDYDSTLDRPRLTKQFDRIRELMSDESWRTLAEIARATGDHEASISAQLRALRAERNGGFLVEKRRRGQPTQGLFEYRVSRP